MANDFSTELSSLQAIFEEVIPLGKSGCRLRLPSPREEVVLEFVTDGKYPFSLPTMTVHAGLPAPMGRQLIEYLEQEASTQRGEPVIFLMVTAAQAWLESSSTKDGKSFSSRAPSELSRTSPQLPSVEASSATAAAVQPAACKFFKQGKCRFGEQCHNFHPGVRKKPAQEGKVVSDMLKDEGSASKDDESEKKASMRPIIDVIHRIQWDDELDTSKFVLGYLDRFVGAVERPFSAFCWEDLASVDSRKVLAVPKHRFQFVKYNGEIVWDKRIQLDNFFGSRGDGTTIADIVANHKEKKTAATAVDIDQDDLDHDGHRPRRSDADRPNYFVCVRMASPAIRHRAQEVQEAVVSRDDRLRDGLLPITAMHVTVCVLQVKNDSQLQTAKRVISEAQRHMVTLFADAEPLQVKGVSDFRGRVVYGALEVHSELPRLNRLLLRRFHEAGIATPGNYEPYTPHMTLVKMSRPMCREMASSRIDPASYEEFANAEFGIQKVDTIHLCQMLPVQNGDFYKCEASVDMSLVCLSPLMPGLLTSRATQLYDTGRLGQTELSDICAQLNSDDQSDRCRAFRALEQATQQSFGFFEDGDEDLSSTDNVGAIYVMRGLPGSGKSYLTHALRQHTTARPFKVCSADDYFESKGGGTLQYDFHADKLDAAHQHCLDAFLEAIAGKAGTVVVDNTHVQGWEYSVYLRLAKLFGYTIQLLEIPCPDVATAKIFASRCEHRVPQPTVLRMHERWEKDYGAVKIPAWMPGSEQPALDSHVRERKSARVVYAAVFLTQKSRRLLLEMYPPSHSSVYGDHCTLCFAPSQDYVNQLSLGTPVQLSVNGVADNGRVQAVAVTLHDGVKSENNVAHVTISTGPGGQPKDSNAMLESALADGKALDKRGDLLLSGTIGCVVLLPNGRSRLIVNNDLLRHLLHPEPVPREAAIRTGSVGHGVSDLYVFDFDGTLVDTVGPAEGPTVYRKMTDEAWPHEGWLRRPESLKSPLPVYPGPAMAVYRQVSKQPNSRTILLSGRKDDLLPVVRNVLRDFDCEPDEYILCPADAKSTSEFKRQTIASLVRRYQPSSVHLWEDLSENLVAMHAVAKQHKSTNWSIEDVGPLHVSHVADPLLRYIQLYGALTTSEDRCNGHIAVDFIARAWQRTVAQYLPESASAPLRHLVKPFGSYLLGRRSDVDLCLLAPSCAGLDTPMQCMEAFASQLEQCGVCYLHRAYSSRCPCLRVKCLLVNAAPVEFDLLFAVVPVARFKLLQDHGQSSRNLLSVISKSDAASRTALGGPVFSGNVLEAMQGYCTREVFAAVVEATVLLLRSANLKGNAYHMPRTFHLVKLLAQYISQLDADTGSIVTATNLFQRFIHHTSTCTSQQWSNLFKEFVPQEFIPPVKELFAQAAASLTVYGHQVDFAVFLKPESDPTGVTLDRAVIKFSIECGDDVQRWQHHQLLTARLGTYVRQLLAKGISIRPQASRSSFVFVIWPFAEDKIAVLSEVLSPLLKELRHTSTCSVKTCSFHVYVNDRELAAK